MRASVTSIPGGKIEFWNDAPDFGATAVFEVMVDYQTADGPGQQKSKLVIDCMDFTKSPWDSNGSLHGRLIKVKPVDEDDMHGSIYFLATHTPVHVQKIKVGDHLSDDIVEIELHYRLLFDQSGLANDVDAVLTASLEVVADG